MRTQCQRCPWRHPEDLPEYAVEAANDNPDGFVCHIRCGPCPGPRLAGFPMIDAPAA